MFCPKCGEKNPDEARFCGKCGAPLTAPAPVPTPSSSGFGIAPPTASAAVSPGLKISVLIGIVFFPYLGAIAGIILGIVFMNDANPAKKAVGRLWLFTGIGMLFVWGVVGECVKEMNGHYSNW